MPGPARATMDVLDTTVASMATAIAETATRQYIVEARQQQRYERKKKCD